MSVFGVLLVRINEYGEIFRISPYSVRMWENPDQQNSEYRHFSRSVLLKLSHAQDQTCGVLQKDYQIDFLAMNFILYIVVLLFSVSFLIGTENAITSLCFFLNS